MPEAAKVSSNAFRSLLGLETTKNADPNAMPDNITFVQRFTKSELQSVLTKLYVAPEQKRTDLSADGIIPYLKPIHAAIGNEMKNVDKMRALSPEIEQSKILVSSSIMSPNDLQDGRFIFSFTDVPGLDVDPDLEKEIIEVYDKFYNDTLELGIRSYDWIGEIQYSSGSKPILILPNATHAEVHDRTFDKTKGKASLIDFGPGYASFEEWSNNFSSNDDFLYSGRELTWREVLEDETPASTLEKLVPSMESFGVDIPSKYQTSSRSSTSDMSLGDEYVRGLESMIVNVRTKLEEGDVIKVSENPEIMRFHTERKAVTKEEMYNKLKKKYNEKKFIREEMVQLDPNPSGYQHEGHPTIIELPSESVIPIFIPGAPNEHIGYFVLIDKNGQPLTIDESGMLENSKGCNPGSASAAYEALLGTSCCSTFNDNTTLNNASNMIFQGLLDKYLKARMKGIFGRDDLSVGRFNSISTYLFYRLLKEKKTTILFVPPHLLHYFAFSYDEKTGAGISKLRDIQFLLSLRTTLLMSNVLAAANDAVEHKKIEFGVDDKVANLEGIMDLIANTFIAKNKLNGSIDPSEIMRDMYSNALTIVPKNIPGLSDLTVDYSSGGGQAQRVDDNLLEQLTNLLVSHLDVPPSALNQMSEPEFARSLVTMNLFFAKKISRYQRIWCSLMQEFIKVHSSFDPIIQRAIRKKLEASGKKQMKEKLPKEVQKMKDKNPNDYEKQNEKLLQEIMENVTIELATPNIVVDKTQFEEIRNFLSNADEMSQQLFSQELVPSEDSLAQNGIQIIRAQWKREQLMRFIEQVGSFKMVETKDLEDVDISDTLDFIQTCQNIGKGIEAQRNAIEASQEDNGFGSGGYGSDMGGGDEFGGGDMGGGMDDMGGGDMDMDMGGMDMGESEGGEDNFSMDMGEEGGGAAAEMYLDLYKKKK